MHRAILCIVADPLCRTLELLLSRKQNQKTEKQVNGLLDILKPYRSQKRSTDCGRAELAEWTTTVAGDLVHRIKLTVQEQLTWVAHVGPTAPPRYSHRLVAVASEILGVEALLDVLADVLKEQTLVGNGSLAIDVCTAMICSSTAATSTSSLPIGGPLRDNRLTLRDALRLRTSNVHELLKLPAGRAEALVRLSRTVEAHLVVPDIPQLAPMAPLLETEAADQVMAELGLTDAGGAEMSDTSRQLEVTAGADFTNDDIAAALNMDQNAMDLSGAQNQGTVDLGANDNSMQDQSQDLFADLNMDLSQSVPNPDGSTQNKEDDIFAGLNMDFGGDDFDFS